MLGLTPGQFCDAGTAAGTVWQRHKTDAKRDAGSGISDRQTRTLMTIKSVLAELLFCWSYAS